LSAGERSDGDETAGGGQQAGPVVSTSRLELRPFGPEDAEALHALFTDAGVRRWLLDDELVPREWVDGEIAGSEARFANGGCGLWALREGPGRPIVGFVGFRHFWDPPELELVYALHPTVWGRGLATEAGRAAISYAFGEMGYVEVLAATDIPNAGSIAVLERLGFQEWKRTDDGPAGTVFFRLAARRWLEGLTTPR
jgi:[ribosomal protein S5]-alanine N-acetyltransferase